MSYLYMSNFLRETPQSFFPNTRFLQNGMVLTKSLHLLQKCPWNGTWVKPFHSGHIHIYIHTGIDFWDTICNYQFGWWAMVSNNSNNDFNYASRVAFLWVSCGKRDVPRTSMLRRLSSSTCSGLLEALDLLNGSNTNAHAIIRDIYIYVYIHIFIYVYIYIYIYTHAYLIICNHIQPWSNMVYRYIIYHSKMYSVYIIVDCIIKTIHLGMVQKPSIYGKIGAVPAAPRASFVARSEAKRGHWPFGYLT